MPAASARCHGSGPVPSGSTKTHRRLVPAAGPHGELSGHPLADRAGTARCFDPRAGAVTGHRRTRPPTRATATGLGTCLQGRAARGAGWGGWLPPAVSGTRDKRRCRVHRCPREPLGGALSQSACPAPTGNHGWPLGGPPRPPAPPRLGAVLPGGGPFTHPDPAAQAGPRHVPSTSPPTSPAEGPRARRRPQGRFGVTQPGFAAAWAALPESGPALV